ncbi:MAG: TIGR01777 family oxidoreductase [Thermoleophilia bacterium]
MGTFEKQSHVDATAAETFAWHERPGALERLTPPWERVRVVERRGGLEDGSEVVLEVRKGPLRRRWVARHRDYEAGRRFVDEQVEGPFARWRHTHEFLPNGGAGSTMRDLVEYALPLGPLGALVGGPIARKTIERMFDHRHAQLADDLARHRDAAALGSLRIAVTGASGLVGSALVPFLETGGHRVARVVRRTPAPGEIGWDPSAGRIDVAALEGVDAVVHLAGEPIVEGRWTAEKKERILRSREEGTRVLAEALARLERPPRVLVVASAIGIYGDRGDELLDEASPLGDGFLADVCHAWEAATEPARQAAVRVVSLRTGVVLSAREGALAKMLPAFRAGVGGPVGSGRQWVSWIALDDLVGAIHHAIATPSLAGPVNAVAPEPVQFRELARTLGRVLRRPAIAPLPAPVVRAVFGEKAAVLLDSARVVPARLQAGGFAFRRPELEAALRRELGR